MKGMILTTHAGPYSQCYFSPKDQWYQSRTAAYIHRPSKHSASKRKPKARESRH